MTRSSILSVLMDLAGMSAALAAACLALTSCGQGSIERPHEYDTPVVFSTYGMRTTGGEVKSAAATTGSEDASVIGGGALRTKADGSFIAPGDTFSAGDTVVVFGFYHDGSGSTDGSWEADEAAGANRPDFMYAQNVIKQSSGAWSYSPVKYWPNETRTDSHGATSEHADKLSFWGYYPAHAINTEVFTMALYKAGTSTAYDNATSGLPRVTFTQAEDPADQIDLMLSSLDATTRDLVKPSVDGKVQLKFRHALSLVEFELVEGTGATVTEFSLTPLRKSGVCDAPGSTPLSWDSSASSTYTYGYTDAELSTHTLCSLVLMPQTLGASSLDADLSEVLLTIRYDIKFASSDPKHPDPIVYAGNEATLPLWSTKSGKTYGVKAWEAGKHYIYKVQAGFERIEFEEIVESADSWTVGNDNIPVPQT